MKLFGLLIISLMSFALLLFGCGGKPEFTEALIFAGVTYSPEVLNRGKENYTLYCRACHGENGDGKGPAAKGLYPPPRDFRLGTIKFASVKSGSGFATNDDFHRVVINGLNGTAMLPWEISKERLDSIIAYMKTFSPKEYTNDKGVKVPAKAWRASNAKIGEAIVWEKDKVKDPFGEKQPNFTAIELGKMVYHGLAECISCHPAYATKEYIHLAGKNGIKKRGLTEFRKSMYEPELKPSAEYGFKILPTDFTYHKIRAGTYLERDPETKKRIQLHTPTVHDLFRTIAAGIGGTAMPAWKDAIPDEYLWAMAHYVKYLYELKDADQVALRATLEADEAKAFAKPSAEIEAQFVKDRQEAINAMNEYYKVFVAKMSGGDDDDDDDDDE